MRSGLGNKTGTANLRRTPGAVASASLPRLIPGVPAVSRSYNHARATPRGAGEREADKDFPAPPAHRMVIDVAERKAGQGSSRRAEPAPATPADEPAQRGEAGGRALVVERDESYAALASTLLRRDGWEVELEPDGPAALQRLHADGYNVVLVDTAAAMLENGESLLAQIRGASDAPVIVLSAQEDREEVVEEALDRADYDLVKPFSPRRFRAAVRVVSRRGRVGAGGPTLPSEVRVGDVTMSFGRLEVVVGERRVELSPREFALLHLMLAHPGTVFTREELARLAWGWRGHTDSRAIDNSVRRLRQKIEPDSRQPRYIVTERGAGYRFAVP